MSEKVRETGGKIGKGDGALVTVRYKMAGLHQWLRRYRADGKNVK
jgi:hypothetical protein